MSGPDWKARSHPGLPNILDQAIFIGEMPGRTLGENQFTVDDHFKSTTAGPDQFHFGAKLLL